MVLLFIFSVPGLGMLKQQFFPNSDRTEVLVEGQMPEGTNIETTSGVAARGEEWLKI